ncbi:alpha-L-fucosidase [Desertivirga brevis]|uniref:alpha-L-fucosidase n=1 Tax=Desertivirga brevis TaxID=2810310 RepID=UPI001F605827|nr:alpha-L-fucosidase [Pedobacter sp. SYSU D00873]
MADSSAQKTGERNSVIIESSDSYEEIIDKAATIVPTSRQLRWQQLEMTGFIHFGMNTFTGKEWGDGTDSPAKFNPTNLDAEQWVRICKEAGIKQVILTAKHHDGFCLWPSDYTDYSVKSSPWKAGKGDVVRETAEACRKHGIGFGIYLSPWDRNSKLFGNNQAYNAYFMNQLKELLSNYGRVDEVWFDGANGEGPGGKKQDYDFDSWYKLIRKLQPQAVIAVMGPDVRWVGTESGYGRETEWSVVPVDLQAQEGIAAGSQKEVSFAPKNRMEDDLGSREKIVKAKALVWYPSEIDVSIRPGWFYHPEEDNQVKSPEKLTDIYFHSVGKNGVLLLNIPPDTGGLISNSDVTSLKGFRSILNKTFSKNYASEGKTSSNKRQIKALTDNVYSTDWTTKGKDSTATINITLKEPQEIDILSIQENIMKGQRVEAFSLEYKSNGEWKLLAQGTTVGYKRLCKFPPVKGKEFRINILSSRRNPVLSEIGLYKQSY